MMPPVLVGGPGQLSISLDGNTSWSAGVPIMFFDAVSATVARRPYFAEEGGYMILQSDPALDGATLDVSILLTPFNKSWWFRGLPGGAKARLLPLSFAGLPQRINNDLVVTVTVRGVGNWRGPWRSVGNPYINWPFVSRKVAGAIITTIKMYTRLIRAGPPPSSSGAVPVQIDHEHTGSLLVGGKRFVGIGWYVNLNLPTCVSGANPRNVCDEGIPNMESMAEHVVTLGKQGVNLLFIYHLSSYNASAQKWLLDQASNAGIKLLLGLPTAPPGGYEACGEWQNDTGYKSRIARSIAVAQDHPATLVFFLCDDCDTPGPTWADNYRCIALKAQLYNFLRSLDPYHVLAGAISGTKGWWFSDIEGFLPPTPDVLSQPELSLGSQPITQLSVDFFLMENYDPQLSAHSSRATNASDWKADGVFTQGLKLDAVANSAGLWYPKPAGFPSGSRTYDTAAAFNSVMWLGIIEGGMSHQLAFIYGEFEEVSGDHLEFTSQVGRFGKQLAPLAPAIHRSVATDEPPHPSVSFVSGISAGAWRARGWRLICCNRLRRRSSLCKLMRQS
jgi:hypothetical protein